MSLFLAIALGYVLGSLPFGYLVARSRGVNIFEVGSKNPGATNVGRVLGAGWGRLVLVLDALKGAVATGWPMWAARWLPDAGSAADRSTLSLAIAGLVASILGHSFSCFTKFKGGKGVATGAGGFVVLAPIGAAIAFAVWYAVRTITRYVSLASILAAISLPISAWFLHSPTALIVTSALVAVFVVIRHRSNISRLIAGTEAKIGQPPPDSKS